MLGFGFLILHVIIYSSIGVFLYAMRGHLSLIPFYMFLGILQVYVSIMSSFYVIDLGFGIQVGGGNIVYAAVIWSIMLLYIMERDPELTKMVVYGLIAIQIVFLLVYPLIYFTLESTVSINPLMIPSEIFQTSFWIFIIGNLLALVELLAMVYVLERLSTRFPKTPPSVLVIITYILTLLADGILFPLLAFPATQSISVVQGIASILNKLFLGFLFSITMLIAIFILKPKFTMTMDGPRLSLSDLFSLPKREVVDALRRSEEDRKMIHLLLSLLSHDITNHNQSLQTYLELIEMQNPNIDEKSLHIIKSAKQVVWESTDLVRNVLSLNQVQEESMKAVPVSLATKFDKALERTQRTYATVALKVNNRNSIENINVLMHPLLVDVLYNILSNSIKHRNEREDHVEIDLSLQEMENFYIFGIADRGPGIPDEIKTIVLASVKPEGQRGLGLSIVKSILLRFNAEIWIENISGTPNGHAKGTIVYIKMPKAK
ncbi:MAG: sensor histidine kinase [Candidatus Thorarchaeota archaeon]